MAYTVPTKLAILVICLVQLHQCNGATNPNAPSTNKTISSCKIDYVGRASDVKVVLTLICSNDASRDISRAFDDQSVELQCEGTHRTHMQHVHQLKLVDCELEQFPDLRKFDGLNEVDASSAGLQALKNGQLPGLTSVPSNSDIHKLKMDLSANQLARIEQDFFDRAHQLIKLDLSHNQIDFVDSEAFLPCRRLESLILSSNLIAGGSAGPLQGLPHVQELRLDNNGIRKVADIIHFQEDSSVRFLDLSKNPIVKLNAGDFHRLRQLQHLNVSHAQLESIELGAFAQLHQLQVLDLSHNAFKTIEYGIFLPAMPSLLALYLNDNLLTELDPDFGQIFPAARAVHVTSNRLNCSYLAEFLRTLKMAHLDAFDANLEHDIGTNANIRGITCDVVAEPDAQPAQPVEDEIKRGFGSGYNVSIFILVLWIGLTNMVICGAVIVMARKAANQRA